MKKHSVIIIGVVLVLIALVVVVIKKYNAKPLTARFLPVMGTKKMYGSDTVFHTTANFSFINQMGDTITEKNVENKNFVVEFFFVSCQSICPMMNKNMMKIADALKEDADFKILSHTVKPEDDSVSVLLEYAQQHNANNKQWYFLTGNKKDLYNMARYSYLVNNETGDGGGDDFIHTQLFALVDKQRQVRGFYDGTDDKEVQKLISDITLLKKEEALNLANK